MAAHKLCQLHFDHFLSLGDAATFEEDTADAGTSSNQSPAKTFSSRCERLSK